MQRTLKLIPMLANEDIKVVGKRGTFSVHQLKNANFHITRVELPKELTKTLTEEPTKVGVAFPGKEKPVSVRDTSASCTMLGFSIVGIRAN